MKNAKEVVIIGAGAAGLVAAYLCARNGARVTLLEKNTVVGKKLSMTGNGRANLTNYEMNENCYNPAARELARSLLTRFGTEQVVALFRELGIPTRSENGYVYPVSGEAAGVVRALEQAVCRAGVRIVISAQAKRVEIINRDGVFCVVADQLGSGLVHFWCDSVILASGGLAGPDSCKATGDGYYMAELLGIPVTPRFPALTGLKSPDASLNVKNGIRLHACVRLLSCGKKITEETGEVQITNGILSGIPVMQLSREVQPLLIQGQEVSIELDLFPDMTDREFASLVQERIQLYGFGRVTDTSEEHADSPMEMTLSDFLLGLAPSEMNALMAARFHLTPDTDTATVETETLTQLMRGYKNVQFRIKDVCDYKRAQVTAGGIEPQALTQHMESVQRPGFYAIGEVVDADGRCGGYNLQWAFMTAMAAAQHITQVKDSWPEGKK